MDQFPSIPPGKGQQIDQTQGQIAQAEEGPGLSKKRRQQQIDTRPGSQCQSLTATAGQYSPDHGPARAELQACHRNLQNQKGCQMACLMQGCCQQKRRRNAPTVECPKATQ